MVCGGLDLACLLRFVVFFSVMNVKKICLACLNFVGSLKFYMVIVLLDD